MEPKQIVEALLFASDAPLSAEDVARGEVDLEPEDVAAAVEALRSEYEAASRAFQIYEIGGGYQILTRPEYAPYLERFETVSHEPRLSGPALEVLAILAYRQPIGRAEVEHIRGVGSASVLRTLQERDLIEVVGRGEGLGRPLLYGTTRRFLEHFGFRSLDDLPRPEDLPVVLRSRDAEGRTPEPEEAPGDERRPPPEELAEEIARAAEAAPADAGEEPGSGDETDGEVTRPDVLAEVSDGEDDD